MYLFVGKIGGWDVLFIVTRFLSDEHCPSGHRTKNGRTKNDSEAIRSIANHAIEGAYAVAPADLLAFVVAAAMVTNGAFVEAGSLASKLDR